MDIRVPPSLHEAEVERHYPRDPITLEQQPDDDMRVLSAAMASARRNAEQLAELATALRNDRTRTPEAQALELRKAAMSLGEKAARNLDGARQRVGEALKRIETETSAPPPPRDAVALQIEAELRSKLSALPASDRRAAIAAAIRSGDDTIVGAVLRGPAMLSGMDQTEQDYTRLQWRQIRHPEKAARIDRLAKAIEATDTGGNLLMSYVERVSSSPDARQANAQASATESVMQSIQAAE